MNHPTATGNNEKIVLSIDARYFKSKYTTPGFFIAGFLLFFMPFLNIKCNDVKLMSASGYRVATGFEVKQNDLSSLLGNDHLRNEGRRYEEYRESRSRDSDSRIPPNYFMLIAMIVGLAGAISSLVPSRKRWLFCTIAGWIASVCFIVTMIIIVVQTDKYAVDAGFISVSVNFTAWFFISMLAFVIATVISQKQHYREWARRKQEEIEAYIAESGYGEKTAPVTDGMM